MSHVREGELHAYLDGALDRLGPDVAEQVRLHLAGCEDCQSRVEQERELREHASSLLDRAMPREIVAPPFEELRRRAAVGGGAGGDVKTGDGSRSPVRRSPAFPAWKWAWAASLVLALGTGWMMGEGSLDFRDFQVTAPAAESSIRDESEALGLDADRAAPELESAELDVAGNAAADPSRVGSGELVESRSTASGAFGEPPANPQAGVRRDVATPSESQQRDALRTDPKNEQAPQVTELVVGAQVGAAREGRAAEDIVQEKVEADDARSNEAKEKRAESASAPRLADAPADARSALMSQAEANTEASVDNIVVESFDDAANAVASDGGPLLMRDRPIVAIVDNAVLQQLANGDSVMLIWSSDELADAGIQRLEASLADSNRQAVPAPDAEAERRVRGIAPPEVADGLASNQRLFGRTEPWPTVVQVRRGAALLTAYSTGTEAELRAALEAAGLTPAGG